jgi:excisionase family DNA binding protein
MRKTQRQISATVGTIGTPRETPEAILTLQEAADWLKLRPQQLYELTRRRCQRPLPYLKVGKVLRFRLSAIDAWLTQKS